MEYTDEIILDIIKLMELDENTIDILEDNHGNITIVDNSKEKQLCQTKNF